MLQFFCIFVSEIAVSAIVLMIPNVFSISSIYFFSLFAFFQFIFAPLQGAYSDKHCRKNSLLFALISLIFGNVFLILTFSVSKYFIIPCILLIGFFGNIDVISMAALLDQFRNKNRKVIMGGAFIAQGVSWIIIATTMNAITLQYISFFSLLLSLSALVLVFLYFFDKRDLSKLRYKFHLFHEIKTIYNFFNKRRYRLGVLAFFIHQTGYFLISLFQALASPAKAFLDDEIYFASGFILGLLMQMLTYKSEEKNIILGILISLCSLILTVVILVTPIANNTIGFFYFTFAVGTGITLASFYAFFTKSKGVYQEGKLIGVVTSVQVLGNLIPAIFLSVYIPKILYVHLTITFLFALIYFMFKKVYILTKKKKTSSKLS